jgi:eukaryotic-like serine/threonine-protein kinase
MPIDAARAKSLFLAASDLSNPAERAAYLDRECGGDADLRARVEALLRANDAAPLSDGDAQTGAHTPHDTNRTEDYADPTASIGAVLACKYKLVEAIGEGGMGSVYMAQQTEPVKRAVAVKVIKVGMDSKAVLARFEAERQALAMMDHPNIAKVLDAGTTDGGRPFFVMELVKGMPITKFCDERKLTPRQRLELFVPVCQAIQHAHQKGIIHRDIKPNNVIIALYDDKPVPKVIDFGVAKAAGQSLTDMTLMTGFGTVVGTPEYMSPEQASLNNLDIDTRSDVYSLGVLLYELLTGTTPVDRKSLGKAAMLEILRIVREVEAPKPSSKLSTIDTLPSVAANRGTEPAKLSRLMRGELDWVLLKALEKDRTRRYDSANALSRDIQRYLVDEVVEARPPSTGYRLRKYIRRNKGQVIAVSLVLLALVSGIAGTTWGLIRAEQRRKDAEQARTDEAKRVTERDDALKGEFDRGQERDIANDELKHRLGVSAMVLANAAYDNRDFKLAAERLDLVPVEQRGWEWHYLKRQLRGGIFTLSGHTGPVTCVAFSPDGRRIVTGGGYRQFEAKVWDAQTGIGLFDLKGLSPDLQGMGDIRIVSVAFSPDSKRIVTAGGDLTARVFDATTGALQLELKEQREVVDEVKCAAFSPDGTLIVTAYQAGSRGFVKMWDARSGKFLREWKAGDSGVLRLKFSPDGTRIVTGGHDQAVKVWDAQKATLLLEAKGMMGFESDVAFSPDGLRLVAGREAVPGQDGDSARVIDARTGAVQLVLKGRPQVANAIIVGTIGVLAVAYSPDGSRIVTGGTTGRVGAGEASVWDARTGAELLELKGHAGIVVSAAFSPDGTRIITGSEDGTAKVWDARTGTPRLELEGVKGDMVHTAFSADGKWMAASGKEHKKPGQATVCDAWTGTPKFTLNGFRGAVSSVAISKDGTRIATGSFVPGLPGQKQAGFATIWDAQTGMPLHELKGLKEIVTSLAFSPDGEQIITGGYEGLASRQGTEAKVWDARTGTVLLDLIQPQPSRGHMLGQRVNVAFSPDGKRIFVSGARTSTSVGDMVTIWDARTGAVLRELKGRTAVMSAVFSPDSARIVTGAFNNMATVWDVESGTALLELKGHTGNVYCVAMSPDGKRIATASADRTVRVWDARTGTTVAELKGHSSAVTSVSFSADGTRLLTASRLMAEKPGEVFVWDAPIPRQEVELVLRTAWVNVVAFSPNGTRIATCGDKMVRVWDTRTGAALLDLKGHAGDVQDVAFSADGTRIASCDGTTAKVWDAKTGAALFELKGQIAGMGTGTSIPGGNSIGGIQIPKMDEKDGPKGAVIQLPETTGTPPVPLNRRPRRIERVWFSRDGSRLFTGSGDGPPVAWDTTTGKEVQGEAIPPMDRKERLSPDGRVFARLDPDGNRVVLVSLVPDEEEIAYRRLHMAPDPRRYRAGYLAARTAKDDFAAAFFLNLIPPDERKGVLAQADADAFAALNRLAREHHSAGKLDEAVPLFVEILNVNKSKLGLEDPATIEVAQTLAWLYHQLGQFEKSIPMFEDVLKRQMAKHGREHEQTLNALSALGTAYKDAGKYKEAIAVLEEQGVKNASLMPHLLDAYALAGEHAKIVDLSLKQLELVRKAKDEGQATYTQADLLLRLGRAYLAQKKWADTEAPLREHIALREKEKWPDNWLTFDVQSMLGRSLSGQMKYAEAEPLLLKGYQGLKQREKSLEARDVPRLHESLDRLIEFYTATNKPDEVKKWRAERAKYPTKEAPMKKNDKP